MLRGKEFSFCRLCLCRGGSLTDILLETGQKQSVSVIIQDLLQLKVVQGDRWPWLICHPCVKRLSEFRDFKARCIQYSQELEHVEFGDEEISLILSSNVGKKKELNGGTNSVKEFCQSAQCEEVFLTCKEFDDPDPYLSGMNGNDSSGMGACGEALDAADVSELSSLSLLDKAGDKYRDSSLRSKPLPQGSEHSCFECGKFFQTCHHFELHSENSSGCNHTWVLLKMKVKEEVCRAASSMGQSDGSLYIESVPAKVPIPGEVSMSTNPTCTRCGVTFKSRKNLIRHLCKRKLLLNNKTVDVRVAGKRDTSEYSVSSSVGQLSNGNQSPCKIHNDCNPCCSYCNVIDEVENILAQPECKHGMDCDAKGDTDMGHDGSGYHKKYPSRKTLDAEVTTVSAEVGSLHIGGEELEASCPAENRVIEVNPRVSSKGLREVEPPISHETAPQQDIYNFLCTVCDKSFSFVGELRKHIREGHNVPSAYVCKVCSKGFACNDDFQDHWFLVHNIPKKNTKLPAVNQYYRNQKIYIFRTKASQLESNKFQCNICHEILGTAANLDGHAKSHLEINRYSCFICPKLFSLTRARDYHLDNNHLKLEQYQCVVCGERFKFKTTVHHHYESSHT